MCNQTVVLAYVVKLPNRFEVMSNIHIINVCALTIDLLFGVDV